MESLRASDGGHRVVAFALRDRCSKRLQSRLTVCRRRHSNCQIRHLFRPTYWAGYPSTLTVARWTIRNLRMGEAADGPEESARGTISG